MCAIFGIVGRYDLEKAKEAFDVLRYRGMDGSAFVAEPALFLGSHRLAITTEGSAISQPLVSPPYCAAFNGEIYNYKALAKELQLDEADEISVIVESYHRWGDNLCEHLQGMYAIAIYDGETLRLFRDPFVKKPLYYCHTGDRLLFSSEIKALLPDKEKSFDTRQIQTYLSYQSPIAPDTFYHGVKQLGAGESLLYDGREVVISRHYSPLQAPSLGQDKEELLAVLAKTLQEAVSIRIPTAVPYASLLSGGLDSSLIAAMAAKEGALSTYCIGYEGYEKYDERRYARQVASHIGSTHQEVIFGKEDFFQSIESVLALLDEPLADPAMLPLFYLMHHISKDDIKVVLTGDGSDELFMGYKSYAEYADLEQLATLGHKNWLKNHLKAHFSMNKEWEWHKRVLEGSTLFRSTAEIFTDRQQNQLLKKNIRDNASLESIESYVEMFQRSGRNAPADWYSYLDLKVMLGEVFLKKLDRMSMVNGVEARSPFLDKNIVNIAFGVDPVLRMGSEPKQLIKELAQDYLPASIIYRKKKGLNYPFMEWLQEENALAVIEEVQKQMGLFNDEHLHYLLEKGKQGMFKRHLFSLFMLCKWIMMKDGRYV